MSAHVSLNLLKKFSTVGSLDFLDFKVNGSPVAVEYTNSCPSSLNNKCYGVYEG